jgi:hypothetical protein
MVIAGLKKFALALRVSLEQFAAGYWPAVGLGFSDVYFAETGSDFDP